MAKVKDKYIYCADNGKIFNIEVVNVNNFREPSMKYACDVYDENGKYAGDYLFFGDAFLNNCEKVN